MKKLTKSEMLKKKQILHVRAERDILARSDNPVRTRHKNILTTRSGL
jgi:hypothetical protein